jgi:2-keto-3-deoxy-6-phosphogluconate aldolase
VTLPSAKKVAVTLLPSTTLDHIPFVSSNHARFHVVLVRDGGGVTMGVTVTWAAVAAGVAGVCAGWLVQPVMITTRRSRPIHAKYRTFILNEELVRKNKHSGSTGRLP